MSEYAPGQRWVNDAEPELGLGIITQIEGRTLHLLFPASGVERFFARDNNPLLRVRLAPGDEVQSADGWLLKIEALEESDGLISYLGQREDGRKTLLPETRLDHSLRLNRPIERLLAGRYDPDNWFELRQDSHQRRRELLGSPLLGLGGARTSLIPHQLYIAQEVARRQAPRVLLADEVGLGKTIEAGLILHQQLLSGRAQRVLILVPESLQHQWLIEMRRRFGLAFSLFDEARCLAIENQDSGQNPFASEQLVLAGLGLFCHEERRLHQALAARWDLLVVDEAHHLEWSAEAPSRAYQAVEQLAGQSPGVLLLTATPEQLGELSHFARLRLLDPARFQDFDRWQLEEASYAPLAQGLTELLEGQPLSQATLDALSSGLIGQNETDQQALLQRLENATTPNDLSEARALLAEQLLDRHGTGRILFRNRRAAISGFPKRQLHQHPLPLPEIWQKAWPEAIGHATLGAIPDTLLAPECLQLETNDSWTDIDPRVDWLIELLKTLRPARVLLIAARRQTVIDLAAALRNRTGITPALFHEAMSLIERDRAAACFADPESSCRLLLCSEIGSEGRNFQFAHHLVLFDLPFNPGLLEQRIGRLDRIGQNADVQIHLPCLADSPLERLALCYHQGLNAFEQSSAAPQLVFEALRPEILAALSGTAPLAACRTWIVESENRPQRAQFLPDLQPNSPAIGQKYGEKCAAAVGLQPTTSTSDRLLEPLLELLQTRRAATEAQLAAGRNPLLEYNSCRPRVAEALVQAVAQANEARPLQSWLERLMDAFDMESDLLSDKSFLIRQGVATPWGVFPGLGEEGLAATCDRDTALANEDLAFLTWEHPFVSAGLEASASGSRGNSACTALKHSGLPPGTLLLEAIFLLDAQSGRNRYLPPTPLRLLLDERGHSQGKTWPPERIKQLRQPLSQAKAKQLIKAAAPKLKTLLQGAEAAWRAQVPRLTQTAIERASQSLGQEINRLKALQPHNPSIRDEEIELLESELAWNLEDIGKARLHPDAIRLMVTL